MRDSRLLTLSVAALLAVGASLVSASPASALPGIPQVHLKVLVVTDGSAWVEAIRQQLATEGVPATVVDLNSPSRPTITDAFLYRTPLLGTPTGFFQGVVLPGNFVPGLSTAEQTSLARYETKFLIRQVEAYVSPNANVGMNPPTYAGTLDAATVTVTDAARSGAFRYLGGTFLFEGAAGGAESWGYLAQPLPNTATTSFTPFLTATVPGGGATGVLAGVYTNLGRERLEISFAYHYYQAQFRHLAHGIVDWVTKGVHLGYWRNYFGVHIDDVFNDDDSWSTTGNCTPGGSACPPGTPDTTPIRMTAADASYAADWQREFGFTMDMLFNGGAQAQFEEDGPDQLLAGFRSLAGDFRWLNHTFTHPYLGCVQDHTAVPWRCERDSQGGIVWLDYNTINHEIGDNIEWADEHGFPINPAELVAGEHSGTLILPQQPSDNPNFVAALGTQQIRYLGLDASREVALRRVGPALGFPRHPINVFYNVSTEAQEVDLYNWIYTSTANGGSGLCENNPSTTCIAPLDPETGWESYILPLQIKIALSYVLRNDPRVFYMHQSNLADDRLAYPVIEGVLATYRSTYAANAPVVNPAFADTAEELNRQQAWAQVLASGAVGGYVQANTVFITGPAGTRVPITAPDQTVLGTSLFGRTYGGETSDYVTLNPVATPLVMLSTPYGLVNLPGLPVLVAPVPPNIVNVPRIALDPGAGLIPGPPDHHR